MVETSHAEVFPLIRAGGVFIVAAGASILLGAAFFRARYAIFGAGAALGALATALTAAPLSAPFGAPTSIQLVSLVVAVGVEVILLIRVLRRGRDEREATLGVLTIVGGHFVLMAPAFGPLIVTLAGLSVGNTFIGLVWRDYSLRALWAIDGAIKAGIGGLMFFGDRLACSACVVFGSA